MLPSNDSNQSFELEQEREKFRREARERVEQLKNSDLELLKALLQGYSLTTIAARSGYSERTISSYLLILYQKLGVHNERDAVSIGIAAGLIRGFDGMIQFPEK